VTGSDGELIVGHEMIDGGPSVLYDAVVLLPAAAGIDDLPQEGTARDFVADAVAHCKFIGYVEAALPLLQKAGVPSDADQGMIPLAEPADAADFIAALAPLRVWGREPSVKMR